MTNLNAAPSDVEGFSLDPPHLRLIRALGGDERTGMCCCPAHDDNQPSLSVGCGYKQPIVLKCFAGCSFEAIKEKCASLDLWPVDGSAPAAQPQSQRSDQERRAFARRIFEDTKTNQGSVRAPMILKDYFANRGLTKVPRTALIAMPYRLNLEAGEDLLIPACGAAMVFMIRDRDQRFVGSHLTWLNNAVDGKREQQPQRQTFGPRKGRGGFIKLFAGKFEDLDPAKPIVVAEGVETALSMTELTGLPAVSTITKGDMRDEALLPPHPAGYIVGVDVHDDESGLQAARGFARRHASVPVAIAVPPRPEGGKEGFDWNDALLRARGDAERSALRRLIVDAERVGPTGIPAPAVVLPPNAPQTQPRTIDEVIAVFQQWLVLKDPTPVYAALGTVAANLLPGDPVWLGLVAPPSSAKTEILTAMTRLSHVVKAATLTVGALLSGTPQRQHARGAKGGLLRVVGDSGMMVLKDFGSILAMHRDARAELLAALREIFDGSWTRHLGTDGGKTLEWEGKMGLLFGVTRVIDDHYGVIGTMGDRFLLCRLDPADGQFKRALQHAGSVTETMRNELAAAVTGLFARALPPPRPLADAEINELDRIITLVVRLRGGIARDYQTREIETVYGTEGTARIGLTLVGLLAGLDTLGVDRKTAFKIVKAIAMDSTPPKRRAAYEYLRFRCRDRGYEATTAQVATAVRLPTITTRRALEELAVYGLVKRLTQGSGHADRWRTGPWGRPQLDAHEES